MAQSQTGTSPLDPHIEEIKELVAQGVGNTGIAEIIGARHNIRTTRDSVRRALIRNNINRADILRKGEPNFTMDGDKATIVGGDPFGPDITPEELMRKHGLNPDDWDVERVIVNKWDGMTGKQRDNEIVPLYQLKVSLVRKKPIHFVFPARTPSDYVAPKTSKFNALRGSSARPKLVAVIGDQQAPYHDVDMHGAVLNFLAAEKPDELVATGDGADFPDISRHRDNPEWHVPAQQSLDTYYMILREYRQANEAMKMVKLPGNHDERIRTELLNRAERLYGIRRAQVPGEPEEQSVLALPYLLRFDELNIEYIDPKGDYEHAQYHLSEHLAVRHGSRTGANAALKTVDRLTHSIIIGHTHGQSITHRTIYGIDRDPQPITAVETGTTAAIRGGLGYAVDPNWVNGFATVSLWPDGTFHVDLATYKHGYLYWRDKRYAA